MPQTATYQRTIIDILIELLSDPENGLGSFFPTKNFFYGPIDSTKISSTPCVIIQNNNTVIKGVATGMDSLVKNITIKLCINARDELGKTENEAPGAKSLELWVEGINSVTGEYDTRSVAGILRKNLSLQQNSVDQELDIDYLPPELTDGRTVQAHITFITTGLKTRTGSS